MRDFFSRIPARFAGVHPGYDDVNIALTPAR